jgi:hypothetical protein
LASRSRDRCGVIVIDNINQRVSLTALAGAIDIPHLQHG